MATFSYAAHSQRVISPSICEAAGMVGFDEEKLRRDVMGSGQSGPFMAVRMAAARQWVALIQRHRFGERAEYN